MSNPQTDAVPTLLSPVSHDDFKASLLALLDLLTVLDMGVGDSHPEMVSARQQARTLLKRYRNYLSR